ncbi:hypothetical protein RJT34_23799 [Clitoria ternatea]|uniref:TPX2 C-terminal domain-containing protein n=1 Tax=Clitoria ternatea TaxID=43366 RepID=A0AAN9FVA4_CLITE
MNSGIVILGANISAGLYELWTYIPDPGPGPGPYTSSLHFHLLKYCHSFLPSFPFHFLALIVFHNRYFSYMICQMQVTVKKTTHSQSLKFKSTMESENGVSMEDEKHVIGESTKENINKEVENGCDTEIQTKNEASESKVEAEVPKSAASKNTKRAKEPSGKGSVASKNNKSATKDKPNLKVTTSSSQELRPNLSKSLSFPAKSADGDGMKKSLKGTPAKTETKHVQGNGGVRAEPSIRHSSRLTKPEVKEEKTTTRNSNQRTSLTSMTGIKNSAFGRSTPSNALAKSLTCETFIPVDNISIQGETEKLKKEDDDVHSTTSSPSPRRRSSGSGFSFRLEERAEKRREFFSKLEEKIQEKEAEKTNQQEKSKESQEAEIKQLRKTMTFKATPMPSFYKEPPPRVELKKIPTTRPKSPKLGRHNHKGPLVNNNPEKSCSSPCGKQQQNDSTKAKVKGNKEVISKKPIRKTQPKLQSQENAMRKTERDSVRSTTGKASEIKHDDEECHDPPVNISDHGNNMELESKNDLAQNGALILNSSTPEVVSYEVVVGV